MRLLVKGKLPAFCLAAIALAASISKAYEPRLDRLEPQGGRRGSEVTVEFFGPRLGIEPQELVFYEAGIETQSLDRVDNNRVKAALLLHSDTELGRHALRLRTRSGLSNLRTFHVGALEELAEVEPNNDLSQAQQVHLNRTVNGLVSREDVDIFQVEAKQGERLSVEVEGLRMGRTFFDPVLELLDATGEIIAQCDDAPAAHQDAFLSVAVPADGKYFVRLRESAYRGDNAATYRLHIGGFPRPAALYPPAGAKGQEVSFQWIGDGLGPRDQPIKLPAEGKTYRVWAEDERGVAPSALEVQLLDAPPRLEAEPNNARDQANAFTAPGHATGILQTPGDRDRFVFTSKKGQAWDLRAVARRLRSPLDPVLRLYDSKGKQLAANDDDRGYPDSYIRFTAPADGEYTLQVEDRLNRGGEDCLYLLEAAKPQAAVEVKIDERRRYEATAIEVPQGGSTAALLTVTRRNVGGDLQLALDNLPSGVTATALPLAGNYNRLPVVFHAAVDAPLAAALCPISAKLTKDNRQIETKLAQQTWFARGRNNRAMWSHFADRAPVVVTKPLPFRLKLAEPRAPLVRGGVKDLKVIAERDEGFDGSIRVYTLYNPPGVSSNRSRSIVKGKDEAIIPATANGNARIGDWNITVVGELNSGGRVYACTPFASLNVAEPYFEMKTPATDARQGQTVELTIELNHRTPFEGEAELKLVRLPPGATAEPVKVNQDATSATFNIIVAADAKPRRHRGVGCQARLIVNGEPVVYTQGYADMRIDPARKRVASNKKDSDQGGEAS